DGFRLSERADRAIFCSEVALADVHKARVSVAGAAKFCGVERGGCQIPHWRHQENCTLEESRHRKKGRSMLRPHKDTTAKSPSVTCLLARTRGSVPVRQ